MELLDLQQLISNQRGIVLYFFNNKCAPCKVLRPKIQDLMSEEFPLLKFQLIDSEKFAEVSACYQVFASPTILLIVDGQEYLRESKNVSITELKNKLQRIYSLAFEE